MAQILLVDDDEQFRRMLAKTLERAGYDVVQAVDGNDALKKYRETPADLVLTDIVMPEKEGIETIMELWRDYPDVKIIAISGGSRNVNPEMALKCASAFGALHTFSKPVDREALLETVRDLLNGNGLAEC
jgi:DNA-binding NtrC family response regulator